MYLISFDNTFSNIIDQIPVSLFTTFLPHSNAASSDVVDFFLPRDEYAVHVHSALCAMACSLFIHLFVHYYSEESFPASPDCQNARLHWIFDI